MPTSSPPSSEPTAPDKLQIRLVPYSPPRLSLDGSLPTSSQSVSGVDRTVPPPTHPPSPDRAKTKGKDRIRISGTSRGWMSGRVVSHVSLASKTSYCDTGRPYPTHSRSPLPSPEPRSQEQEPSPLRRRPKFSSRHLGRISSRQFCSASSTPYALGSAPRSSAIPSGSRDPSSDLADQRPSSPLTPLAEHSTFSQESQLAASGPSSASSSPRNYRFMGGLRKVHRHASNSILPSEASQYRAANPTRLSRLRMAALESPSSAASLHNKQSFWSMGSGSTQSEKSNYKVYAYGSSPTVAATAGSPEGSVDINLVGGSSLNSSCPNVETLDYSSSCSKSLDGGKAVEGEANYVLHGGLSPKPSSGLRSEFSRESLLVPPLRTLGRSTEEPLSLAKSHSRDSNRAGSLSSGISATIEEATFSELTRATAVRIPAGVTEQISSRRLLKAGSSSSRWVMIQQPEGNPTISIVATDGGVGSDGRSQPRSLCHGAGRRHSLGARPSGISLSFAGLGEESTRPAYVTSEYPTHPSPVYRRISTREQNHSSVRLIRDQDEHGDGLADLAQLHHHPSRSRLHSLLSNSSSDRNLQSSNSSRSSSFNHCAIPAWARLYYGSGERRFLASQLSSDSLYSQFNSRSRTSSFLSRSRSTERFHAAIQNSERHPREVVSPKRHGDAAPGGNDSDLALPANNTWPRRLGHQSSSIWSPHLSQDRRANRYRIWESPSTVWSANGSLLSRHQLQPIMFVVGFIFPFAWVIASFLPLPPVQRKMTQEQLSTSHLELQLEANVTPDLSDTSGLYSHARWWRTLNRAMSIVGIFVFGAIIALIVTGVRQKWKS